MKLNVTPIVITRFWTLLISAFLLIMLNGCGGGGASAGRPLGPGSGGGGTTTNGTITVALTNFAGVAANVIPAGGSLTVTAHVVNASGSPVADALVTFSLSSSIGSLPVSSALTNSLGNASVTLQAGSTVGAATLTATTVAGTTAITAAINFQSGSNGSSASPNIALALVSNVSCPANTVTASCPLTANATVTDASGNPVVGTIVTFANSLSYTTLSPTSGSVVTDSNGVATVRLSVVGLPPTGSTGSAGTVNVSTTVGGVTVIAGNNYTLGNTSITVNLVTPPSGTANVNAYGTTTIKVQVDSNGVIYNAQPVTVNFSSGCATSGKATLPATATTVNGIAQVTYTDKGCGATDTVSASVAGVAASVSATLIVSPPVPTSINFTSAVPSNMSIVLPGTGGAGRTSQATLTFTVVDINGNGIPNALVNFSNNFPGIATLNSASASTDSNGNVSTSVTAAGSVPGTFAITAALASNSAINAISNSVIVATGQPVQASFSLSATVFNIEGWNLNGVTTTLSALIADANGNPVVDGTPVQATTNSGSVVGGCLTMGGACSVLFTSQEPRLGTGIATVNFTSVNSTTVALAGSVDVVLSGNSPFIYYQTSPGVWALSSFAAGPQAISTNNCSLNIPLVIADLNGNAMPFSTGLQATTTQTGAAIPSIFPTSIPNTPAGGGTPVGGGVFGTTLVVNFTLAAPLPACSPHGGAPTAPFNFSVTTTTPHGVTVLSNFVLSYPI